jgi:hypothetical protein
MSTRMFIVTLLTQMLVIQSQVFAAAAPLELKWNELNAAIYGRSVKMTLPGAITVKGDVAAIREDGLVLDLKRTSDAKAFPKGNAVIPRASVKLLKLEKGGGSTWHTIGTVMGVLSGVVVGGYLASKTSLDAGPVIAVFLGTTAALTVAGERAGHAADHRTRLIRVVE